jgi:hypothetical protein
MLTFANRSFLDMHSSGTLFNFAFLANSCIFNFMKASCSLDMLRLFAFVEVVESKTSGYSCYRLAFNFAVEELNK